REFRLLKGNANPFAPILMIVDNADNQLVRKAISNCIDDVLMKPIEPHYLRERIDSLIEDSKKAAQMLGGYFENRPHSYDELVYRDRLRGKWA
ncbi:MAG: hypothetical protein KDJ16_04400, partial [Hyphomicrobiales bacterium]|nr:hypothetical protein [Hyphomicrobiales bacterium]